MNKKSMYHDPVLLQKSVEGLNIRQGGTYVDVTFGGGGHSRLILEMLGAGKLFAFDQDSDAVSNKIDDPRFVFINQNFKYLKNFLYLNQIQSVDGILADLGVSSHQFDMPERGFSTRFSAPLDMRMNKNQPFTAAILVNTYSEEKLNNVLKFYGELKNSFQLTKAIISKREIAPINTTGELVAAVEKCFPPHKQNKFLAMVFQALRIEVNDELGVLKEMLTQSLEMLNVGGRLVVISYHSLEDRLVKNFIKTGNFEGILEKDFYGNPLVSFKAINTKPIIPEEEEVKRNGRARSAKLRIAEKIK
ncbi:MAG TPA: 16S rRNA (cytosine(1402)-N(4))-methyltransferase RsmH [Bacteroidales bacterium]